MLLGWTSCWPGSVWTSCFHSPLSSLSLFGVNCQLKPKKTLQSANLKREYSLSLSRRPPLRPSLLPLSLLSNTPRAPLEERVPARRVACVVRPTCGPSITAVTLTQTSHCCDCPVTLTSTRAASSHVTRWSTWVRMGPRCRIESWRTMRGRQSLYRLFPLCFEVKRRSRSRHKVRQLELRTR